MKIPKRTKFRKSHRNLTFCMSKQTNSHHLAFGSFGIKALEFGELPSSNIEILRRALTRKFRRSGKVWIRVFPHTPVTARPAEVRMGRGKGSPQYWTAMIPAGQIMFEFSGVSLRHAKQATELISAKMSMKVKLIS